MTPIVIWQDEKMVHPVCFHGQLFDGEEWYTVERAFYHYDAVRAVQEYKHRNQPMRVIVGPLE